MLQKHSSEIYIIRDGIFQRWLPQYFSSQMLISQRHVDVPPPSGGTCILFPWTEEETFVMGSTNRYGPVMLWDFWGWGGKTCHTRSLLSLESLHLGTQPPCCEEAKATRRGHCRCSSCQSDPPGGCLQNIPAPRGQVIPTFKSFQVRTQMLWNWGKPFPVPCLDSWLTGSLSKTYYSFMSLTCGMVYFSLTIFSDFVQGERIKWLR